MSRRPRAHSAAAGAETELSTKQLDYSRNTHTGLGQCLTTTMPHYSVVLIHFKTVAGGIRLWRVTGE